MIYDVAQNESPSAGVTRHWTLTILAIISLVFFRLLLELRKRKTRIKEIEKSTGDDEWVILARDASKVTYLLLHPERSKRSRDPAQSVSGNMKNIE